MATMTFISRDDRRPTHLRGFALGAKRDSDIVVADMSYGGCKIRSDDRFKEGEIVELRIIKRGSIAAEIRWSASGCAGARFLP